jgi:GAF domain-containing protein/ANTAR domain-containing protein
MTDRARWSELLRDTGADRASQPRRIAELCVQMLGVTGAGMSLVTDAGHRELICATDAVSERIEELQITLGEGPCIDTFHTGAPVLVADLEDRHDLAVWRWPTFMAAASDAGVRAVFAFPLRIGAIRLGALDMYRTGAGALGDDELSAALLGAETAAVSLLSLGAEATDAVGDDTGSRHQAQVHQATGMVMVQLGLSIEQAFLLLRARAFAAGRPLNDVANDVVERRVRFSSEDV